MYHIPAESRTVHGVRDLKKWALPTLLSKRPTAAEIEPLGAYIVQIDPVPETTATQIAEPGDVTHENGVYRRGWTVRDKTEAELAQDQDNLRRQVKAERDRRLAADFTFAGKKFQRDAVSLQRITGAATLAGFAIAQGVQQGDLRWANPDVDFGWIASDDTVVPMDAQTTFAFGRVAASVDTAIVFAAKTLREMAPIPEDFTDDRYWP